jgi:hypothetical protein
MSALEDLAQGVRDEIRELLPTAEYPDDLAHEVADNWVPIYNNQLRDLIVEDFTLLTDDPETEAANWWAPALRIVVGNLYERLYEVAAETIEDLEAVTV